MEKQKTTKGSVIAYWVCAGVWMFTLLIDLVCDGFSTLIIVTHLICAVVWTICAILITRKYGKEKEASNDEE